ncbi:glycosyltransferase family 2 protein [Pedobacter sp. MW01-1-1]|uniref:glycosyltransferase family 2 protein n=1 Tax=Pedobacter sp. MW01-1-1 TaxID=3383027 RepID=UPI003FF0D2FA
MKISIIIPCFNDGQYLKEAIDSVLECKIEDKEIIIINDGSTDLVTLEVLQDVSKLKGVKLITQKNMGLAFSRNKAIKEAHGKYIFPLDADNKTTVAYVTKAIDLLEKTKVDIVYAKPYFFGDDIPERKFQTKKFDATELLCGNYIDACAIFRKSVWEAIGGYDENMPFPGNEDWAFWISCSFKGFKFKFIEEELFGYRIKQNSMISEICVKKAKINHEYIMLKHRVEILDLLLKLNVYKKFHERDQKNYLRTSLKYFLKVFRIFHSK